MCRQTLQGNMEPVSMGVMWFQSENVVQVLTWAELEP